MNLIAHSLPISSHQLEKILRYKPGIDRAVDDALATLSTCFSNLEEFSWWDIASHLFINNRKKEAALAQRHAVPPLNIDRKHLFAQ